MHQDIKTFSDLTAIDTRRKLIVSLQLQKHGCTESIVKLNGYVINTNQIQIEFDLFDPIKLEIELLDFAEGTSGIEIVNFSVNGLEILPKYQHLASKSTNYIDFLGVWSFEIPAPFYVWYHQISGQGFIA
jgi:hypothetical protein